MIPLAHDFEGERVLIVGGGPVAARKARHFGAEADVLVASPDFDDADFGGAERVRTAVDPEEAAGLVARTDPLLVVTATDAPAVNDAVATAAREAGAMVNRADGGGGGDDGGKTVHVPATADLDPVTVAVDTGGSSPALSRHLRRRAEREWAGAGELAELLADLRDELAERDLSAERRRDALRAVVQAERVWTALDTPGRNPDQVARTVIDSTLGETA